MDEEEQRDDMVRRQLLARHIHDPRVIAAMRKVPRHLFVPEILQKNAYEDNPQPIGHSQSISQPLMVALMTELLELNGDEKTLEIGTGSGYQTAILAQLCRKVISMERFPDFAEKARCLLEYLGYQNITIITGDGSGGYPSEAPYDRIIVTAAAPFLPAQLADQLANDGRMVIPVGNSQVQTLTLAVKDQRGKLHIQNEGECVFVPLVGEYGWSDRENNE
jgi:protein-L-isoaspartate(D-aspartate) O-methyltransferase